MLHIDYQERIQLLSRELSIVDEQLSSMLSMVLPPIPLPVKSFPHTDAPPRLAFVPPASGDLGGLLVLGGRKLLYYELAGQEIQAKAKGKRNRSEKKKKSEDREEVKRAREKESEREWRKKKAKSWVDWPWSDVCAWCKVGGCETRFLIGDSFGRLAMLNVGDDDGRRLLLIALGEVRKSQTIPAHD